VQEKFAVANDAPLDLSIAKAQAAWWRVFEVKYNEYTLFNGVALERHDRALDCAALEAR
jgi:hypothetical protein